jgi:hypothetical protein
MLNFDAHGLLTPHRAIRSTVTEVKKTLVTGITSRTRAANFKKYTKYSTDLKALVGAKTELIQWVNGSFVTKKANPNDIDIVSFIDHDTVRRLGAMLDDFRKGGSWNAYGVDAYMVEVFPEGNRNHKFSEIDRVEWLSRFTKTKRDNQGRQFPKGFLEIIY